MPVGAREPVCSLQESIHGDVFHIELVAQNTQNRIFADIQDLKMVG
jgi:hypothetical protein